MSEAGSVAGDIAESSILHSLNLDLEELDDAEYDIPPVDQTPTLESILNDDQPSGSDDELSTSLLPSVDVGFEGSETMSVGSTDNRSRSSSERKQLRSGKWSIAGCNMQKSGSILRHIILKGISSQLSSAAERVNAGLPTAMAATTMIAVGTSHGLVLVFDASQTLRWCLGTTDQEQGSVSSLSFNYDCSRLLVGYARGNILMYDILTGKLLRTMSDVHPPGTAVLHVKFTDSPTLALCSDSGGSVFELNFRRTMGIRGCDSKCLFSGSRGEVCCIEPLLLHQLATHPLHGVILVAMATLSKVIVVSIRPKMRVLFTHVLATSPSLLPLITWQFVIIQMADSSRVVDPVLAFARESTIHFYQVCVDSHSKIHFVLLQRLNVDYLVLSLHWLNTRTLAVIDSLELLHLLDVRTQEELEIIELSHVRLVYGTSHFKGLSTGGNVSKAMALAGERACYNSIVSFGNQMLILGTKSFHVLTIRTWNERLNHLIKQGKFLDALALGMDFYLERGKAVVGLKGPKPKRKEIARNKVLEILNQFIDEMLISKSENIHIDLLQDAIPACIGYCIELNVLEILFGKLWDSCSSEPNKAMFLQALEPWLLNDRLRSIPPSVSQQFVAHYKEQKAFQALEACLVHMDVSSLDIHQVMGLCWTYSLYDAIFYIYNNGMKDYVTPLQELMPHLQSALATGKQLTDEQIALGNKLLVYISCCLAGRAYPVGDIPEEDIQKVKHEVFKCLTCLHSKDASDSELSYPYLRTLLHFDTREFLNVLALAFEEPEFLSELGLRQVQRLVDILFLVMVQGDGFTPSQVGSLFTFLARQLAKPWCSLHVDRQLFEQVVEFLTEGSTPISLQHHEERQQALLELMRAGGLQHYDQNKLLSLALKASFYRVCELIYEQRHEYDMILHCYLRDPLRKPQVFSYLRNIVLLYNNIADKCKVEDQVVQNIQELLDIDAVKTGQIIMLHLPQIIPAVLKKLESEPKMLFVFLQGMFNYRETHAGLGHVKEDLNMKPELVEKYISLMCQYSPDKVFPFIASNDGYRLDNTLQITQEHGHIEATAYLLEKTGDFQGALHLLLNKLDDHFTKLQENPKPVNEIEELTVLVHFLVNLCKRGSVTLDEKGRQAVWFPLLESIMKPQRNPNFNLPVLKELTQLLLTNMSAFVSLPAVLQVILQDPAYADGKFGDIRELMMGMLGNSCYEETLLQATSRLLSLDLHKQLSKNLLSSNRAITARSLSCAFCCKFVNMYTSKNAVLFRCGHLYHKSCLKCPVKCIICSDLHAGNMRADDQPKPVPKIGFMTNHKSFTKNTESPDDSVDIQETCLKLMPPPIPDLDGCF